MSQRRDRAIEAAIELVGTEGIHALSHARVDAAAGLPRGSTSNYFRSRSALLTGVAAGLEEAERNAWSPYIDDDRPLSVDLLAEALLRYVDAATGTDRTRTAARLALAAEAFHRPDTRSALHGARDAVVDWSALMLGRLGVRKPLDAAEAILMFLDGIIMYRLTTPDGPLPDRYLRQLIASCVTETATGPGDSPGPV